MAIDGIQLTTAAIGGGKPPMVAGPMVEQGANVEIGQEPTDKEIPEELQNKPLAREEVENFLWEIQNQPAWRREADRCCDYYDSNQLDQDTIDTLKERGQPPLITNIIKPTIDTVLGMEAKTRTDWRVRPEDDEQCDDDMAEALSVKLKHAETESRADRACSDAYAGQLKAGLGWVEVARESDPFVGKYRVEYIHRREIFWDWRAVKPDLQDAKYIVRRRWLELDHSIAMFPQYATLLRMTVSGWSGFDPLIEPDTRLAQSYDVERDTRLSAVDWRDSVRQRVCISEIWYRKWVRGYVMTLPNGKVIEADFNNPKHNEAIVAGLVELRPATFQKVRLAWYVGPHFLYDVPSPYKHNRFPYVPFFGYREDLTNAPYGLIRSMISPQDEVNARKSKMLWSLNSRRVITDSDAVKDHRRAMAEVARPDAYIILDKDRKPQSTFKVEPGGELAVQQFQVMQEAKQEIAEASGIHKSMQGQESGARSGLAINSLIEQGLNTLAEINDNYRYARRLVGEMLFELVVDEIGNRPTKVTTGNGKKKKLIVLNMPMLDPETGMQTIMNDVRKVKAKIVLDDIPSTPTYRMQQLQMLTEITKSLPPELQAATADFIIEATDMPNRHEVADRIRAVSGIQDEEQQAAMAEQQQAMLAQEADRAAKAFVLDAALKAAQIRKTNAEADNLLNPPEAAAVESTTGPVDTPQVGVHAPSIQ